MTASKPTTAKSKPGRPKKDEAPAFDFGELEFHEAEMPKRLGDNPFRKPLGESYEYDMARAVVIPAAGQARAESLIRRAAVELEIGATVVVNDPAVGKDGKELPGMVEVVFKGKERRKRKGKGDDAPTAGSEPAVEDAAPAGVAGEPAAASA
jgi:hypothetical protein